MQLNLKIDFPEVFSPLIKPARYKGAWGGRGSGKSWFFGLMTVIALLEGKRVVCKASRSNRSFNLNARGKV